MKKIFLKQSSSQINETSKEYLEWRSPGTGSATTYTVLRTTYTVHTLEPDSGVHIVLHTTHTVLTISTIVLCIAHTVLSTAHTVPGSTAYLAGHAKVGLLGCGFLGFLGFKAFFVERLGCLKLLQAGRCVLYTGSTFLYGTQTVHTYRYTKSYLATLRKCRVWIRYTIKTT
jgi:hypothetical protein